MATCQYVNGPCGQPASCAVNGCFAEKARTVALSSNPRRRAFIPYDSAEQRALNSDTELVSRSTTFRGNKADRGETSRVKLDQDKMRAILAGELTHTDSDVAANPQDFHRDPEPAHIRVEDNP